MDNVLPCCRATPQFSAWGCYLCSRPKPAHNIPICASWSEKNHTSNSLELRDAAAIFLWGHSAFSQHCNACRGWRTGLVRCCAALLSAQGSSALCSVAEMIHILLQSTKTCSTVSVVARSQGIQMIVFIMQWKLILPHKQERLELAAEQLFCCWKAWLPFQFLLWTENSKEKKKGFWRC